MAQLNCDVAGRYFICGTIGELTLAVVKNRRCEFDLIPDEDMKVVQDGVAKHLWLSGITKKCKTSAMVCDGKVVHIDFTNVREKVMPVLLTAKSNAMRIRVYADKVDGRCSSLCALSIM